jgi:SNF2 family DNA or RNA helicase
MSHHTNSHQSLYILNDAYKYSLTSDSDKVAQPSHILTPLRNHQKSVLFSMKEKEQVLNKGMDISGAKLYSSFAVLGDGVGVGKSLMVLGHISNLKKDGDTLYKSSTLTENSSNSLYSIQESTMGVDLSNAGCLIVVPHTLFKQWEGYIAAETTLSCYGVKTKTYLDKARWTKDKMLEKDIVLISNTLYGKFQAIMAKESISWKRVFYDEADTLHIPSTQVLPSTKFTWFISASWTNLLFPNNVHYFTQSHFNTYINSPDFDPVLQQQLRIWKNQPSSTAYYVYQRYYMVSPGFFRYFLGTNHKYRGRLVLRCKEEYVRESISLPALTIQNIMCMPSVVQRVLANAISPEIRQLLHAGDFTGALDILGVKSEDSTTLIKAVTEHRIKELDRLQRTYEFKSSIEYSTAKAKEDALKNLKQKIDGLEEQIKTLKERIENYKNEICPICFDEPQSAILTNCCSRVFCAGCMLTSLTRLTTCPLCRTPITPSELKALSSTPVAATPDTHDIVAARPLKKPEQLLKLIIDTLQQTPAARFLIFSRYDNPFHQITRDLSTTHLKVKQVQGNKDVINGTLKSFEKGDTRVLLLNSIMAGAGLNITAATHVILLHAMNHEEEKQILGRAYRIGRTSPLTMVRLLHPDELIDTHS